MTEERLSQLWNSSAERQELIQEVRRLQDHNRELQISMDKIEGRNFKLHGDSCDLEFLKKENQKLRQILAQAHPPLCGTLISLETGRCLICPVFR